MAEAFEIWAPREIKRLREEADVLQLALDRFVGSQGRKQKSHSNPTPNDGQGRRSKYEGLFAKWGEASRERPLTYADMERIAREAGSEMDRNLLRSTVHAQKVAGRVRAEGTGYVWSIPQSEAAPSDQEDAAS